jgi:hypothetical protein
MTSPEIRASIEELRHATRPEQRTSYERALLALAELVLNHDHDLRAAVSRPEASLETVERLRQLLRDLVDFDVGVPPELDQLDAEYGSRQLARMARAWEAAIAEVGPRDERRYAEGDPS